MSWLSVSAILVAVLALVLAAVGVGAALSARSANAALQKQVEDLQARQSTLDQALVKLDERTGSSLAEYLKDLDRRVDTAQSAAEAAASAASNADSNAQAAGEYAATVGVRLDAVVECINKYMKTVGDSGGGGYQYFFC